MYKQVNVGREIMSQVYLKVMLSQFFGRSESHHHSVTQNLKKLLH